jgi:predicted ribosomally synthesized peptide with nif11-like leader
MVDGQLKAFLAAIKVDIELKNKLRSASDAGNIVAIAKASGHIISVDELARAIGYAMLSPVNFESYYADITGIVFSFDLVEPA